AGVTLASSNWRDQPSFVGQNYAFRQYFQHAMAHGTAEEFALGTVSGEPGMYFAHRVAGNDGVVVAKVTFEALEEEWAQGNETAVAVNETGMIQITTRPDLRFAPLQSLATGPSLPISAAGLLSPRHWARAQTPVSAGRWTLYVFAPIRPAIAPLEAAGRLVGASTSLAALAMLFLWTSREARRARAAAEKARDRVLLERSVAERTAELQASKDRLSQEFEERMRAEEKIKRMQDDLVQANKLAMLGQISAGVAHELNQPAAAILSYAKNALAFLKRSDQDKAEDNLRIIVELVERIGVITDELRTFARKRGERSLVSVRDVLDSTLLLLDTRLRGSGVHLARHEAAENLIVCVDRIRLEQVLVNLVQNALDAVKQQEAPRIVLETALDLNCVVIAVTDNGPGVPHEIERELFTPFRSTKSSGLGLGLVISRDIVAEFAGSLEYTPAPGGGARFVVRIPRLG
ncbi:MAG: hypothetical protein K2P95_03105, partial [Hyphomonadaceae bacterium]|nr:hypothetical protein [Hyphomonadaceae bacterium]